MSLKCEKCQTEKDAPYNPLETIFPDVKFITSMYCDVCKVVTRWIEKEDDE